MTPIISRENDHIAVIIPFLRSYERRSEDIYGEY
jgi:hypothetical protein